MTTRIAAVRPEDLGQSEIDAWRRIREASPEFTTPFLAPELALGWWVVRRVLTAMR